MKLTNRTVATLFLTCLAASGNAGAASNRTFVASYGADGNTSANCALVTPCRTFGAALTVTNLGGEVVVLDSAGYGPISVLQSVSITASPGTYAGITVPANLIGVEVLANSGPNSNTTALALKGLKINAAPGALAGIFMGTGTTLLVEDCEIAGFSASGSVGIDVQGLINTRIVRTTVRDSDTGIFIGDAGTGSIESSRLLNNVTAGLVVQSSVVAGYTTNVNVSDTISSTLGGGTGFYAQSLITGASVVLAIDRSSAVGNSQGVQAGGAAQVTVSNSLLQNNGYAVYLLAGASSAYLSENIITDNSVCGLSAVSGTTLLSFGNNALSGNSTDVCSGTVVTTKVLR